MPHHIIAMWVEFGEFPLNDASFVFRIMSHCLAYGNSCVNPILYAFLSENFRKACQQVFTCRLFYSPPPVKKIARIRMENFSTTHSTINLWERGLTSSVKLKPSCLSTWKQSTFSYSVEATSLAIIRTKNTAVHLRLAQMQTVDSSAQLALGKDALHSWRESALISSRYVFISRGAKRSWCSDYITEGHSCWCGSVNSECSVKLLFFFPQWNFNCLS